MSLRTRRVACLLPVLLVLACGAPSAEQRLDAYREAVRERVAPASDVHGSRRLDVLLPERRQRRMQVADHRVGLGDFLALQGCRLGELVGARNSQLGRVMVPSRRLVYELDVLESADLCLAELADGRRAEIGALLERKRAELPRHVWNAVWEDGELRDYLSVVRSDPAFLVDPGKSPESALGEIERLLGRRPFGAEEARELERALAGLRGQDTAGALLRRLERGRVALDEISGLLDGVAGNGCDTTRRRLVRVFEAHYVGRVQPDLVALDRAARPVVEALGAIYRASRPDEPPPSMQVFYETVLSPTRGVWPAYRAAVLRHAQGWAPTLAACDALPGGPVRSASTGGDA